MLCRVADNIYWLARYMERADYIARVLDVNTNLVLDMTGFVEADPFDAWQPIVAVSGDEKIFHQHYSTADEQSVVSFLLFDKENPGSIYRSIAAARENARCVREQISSEMWEQINRLYLRLKDQSYDDYQRIGSSEYFNRTKASIYLFYGIAEQMMPRTTGWHFFNLGRFLERADNLSRLIDIKCLSLLPHEKKISPVADLIQWTAVLRSCSGYEAFRKSRQGNITAERVIDYLVLNEHFPKSIRFSIIQAEAALRQVSGASDHHFTNLGGRALGQLRAELDYALLEAVLETDLHEYMQEIQDKIAEVGALINDTFINYSIENAHIA